MEPLKIFIFLWVARAVVKTITEMRGCSSQRDYNKKLKSQRNAAKLIKSYRKNTIRKIQRPAFMASAYKLVQMDNRTRLQQRDTGHPGRRIANEGRGGWLRRNTPTQTAKVLN
jgi:hypothetical protein